GDGCAAEPEHERDAHPEPDEQPSHAEYRTVLVRQRVPRLDIACRRAVLYHGEDVETDAAARLLIALGGEGAGDVEAGAWEATEKWVAGRRVVPREYGARVEGRGGRGRGDAGGRAGRPVDADERVEVGRGDRLVSRDGGGVVDEAR